MNIILKLNWQNVKFEGQSFFVRIIYKPSVFRLNMYLKRYIYKMARCIFIYGFTIRKMLFTHIIFRFTVCKLYFYIDLFWKFKTLIHIIWKKKSAMIKHDHIDLYCCPRQRRYLKIIVSNLDFLWFCNVDNDIYYR